MNLRTTLLVPLVIAAAACGRQDAAPFVAPDPAAQARGSATIKMIVVRDTATSRTAPSYIAAGANAAAGQTRVNLYRADDPTGSVVKTGITNAIGEIVFSGVAPGDYIIKPVVRAKSTTLVPAAGVPVRVAAGSVVTVDTLRVRLSTRISGNLATEWFDQVTQRRIRHSGVPIQIYRETGSGTGAYTLDTTVTTNAIGNYEYFVTPGPERVQVKFNSTAMSDYKPATSFCSAIVSGLCTYQVPYVQKEETITLTGITPGRDITQNLIFNFPTRITGNVFRDRNANTFRDSTLVTPAQAGPPPVAATGTKEGLVAGDTIRVQLRDAQGAHVITSVLIGTGTATSQVPTTSATNFNTAVPTYLFASLEPGTYVLTMDPIASRFTSNPLEFRTGPYYSVVVPTPATGAVTITRHFALVTGQ